MEAIGKLGYSSVDFQRNKDLILGLNVFSNRVVTDVWVTSGLRQGGRGSLRVLCIIFGYASWTVTDNEFIYTPDGNQTHFMDSINDCHSIPSYQFSVSSHAGGFTLENPIVRLMELHAVNPRPPLRLGAIVGLIIYRKDGAQYQLGVRGIMPVHPEDDQLKQDFRANNGKVFLCDTSRVSLRADVVPVRGECIILLGHVIRVWYNCHG